MRRSVQDAVRTLFSNSMGSPGAPTRRPTSGEVYLLADLGQPTPRFIVELPSKFANDYSGIVRAPVFIQPAKSARILSKSSAREKFIANSWNGTVVKS